MLIEHKNMLISTEDKMIEICEPLMQQFNNIKTFTFCRFHFNQKLCVLSTNKDIYLYFFDHETNFIYPFPEDQCNLKRFHYIYAVPDNFFKKNFGGPAQEAVLRFGVFGGINIVEIFEDYCDFYAFCVDSLWINSINNLLTQIELLENFCLYFKHEANDIIKDFEKQCIILPHTMHVNLKPIQMLPGKEKSVQNFFESIKRSRHVININGSDQYVTKTEMHTLRQLAQGHSAKEAARILDLSSHTIDTYVRNLKQRFDCSSKSDLLNFFRQYFLNS